MNASQLLARVRARLDDTVGAGQSAYLWSNNEIITDYAGPVCDRLFLACPELLTDATTASDLSTPTPLPVCQIAVVANTATYALSPKIIKVLRVKLDSQSYPLRVLTVDELDSLHAGWEALPAAKPWGVCLDRSTDSITFIPKPDANDTARLRVQRFPLSPISLTSTAELGFRQEYHADLIPGILAMAYSKKDSGTDRPDLANLEEARFTKRLAEIRDELFRRTVNSHTNRPLRAFGSR